MDKRKPYVPALRYHWLSGIYDPMVQKWSAASRIRESVITALDLQPGMRILEIGAGPGRLAIQIKRAHPEVSITAVDIDSGMIRRANRNAVKAGVDVDFQEFDMRDLTALGCFDRVYSTMVFHHLSPKAKKEALIAARGALLPGGHFVVSDFSLQRGPLQWALFTFIQQPLDGFRNTAPHKNGAYANEARATFATVRSEQVWRTIAGTIEMFVCSER